MDWIRKQSPPYMSTKRSDRFKITGRHDSRRSKAVTKHIRANPKFNKFYKSLNPNDRLFRELNAIFKELEEDPYLGSWIKPKRIPKSLKKQHPNLDNLLLVKINRDWRLLYTLIAVSQDKTVCILDAMRHKEYDKLFGY